MNLVCFPMDRLPKEVLGEILRGGMEIVHEAGALLVGGHSVADTGAEIRPESVTGLVDPRKVVTNAGPAPGTGSS